MHEDDFLYALEVHEHSLPDLSLVLTAVAQNLQMRVAAYAVAIDPVSPGFRDRFGKPFAGLEISFAPLSSDAAFEFDRSKNSMRINTHPVVRILRSILNDVTKAKRAGRPAARNLQREDVNHLLRLAVDLFVLHEVRHISQNISLFSDIQLLKETAGAPLIGELDTIADRDAADAYAMLRMVDEGTHELAVYLDHFTDALWFMGKYCFPTFGAPLQKPHKVFRSVGLTMMLARIVVARWDDEIQRIHAGRFPLNSTLLVSITDSWDRISVVSCSPDKQVLLAGASVDPVDMLQICTDVDSGEFDSVVARIISLLTKLKIV